MNAPSEQVLYRIAFELEPKGPGFGTTIALQAPPGLVDTEAIQRARPQAERRARARGTRIIGARVVTGTKAQA